MKQENARLLQHMSYEEYVETPEWQQTRKRMLKHVGQRCQDCHEESISLSVHHWDAEHFGREQPEDLIVLCQSCYVKRKGKEHRAFQFTRNTHSAFLLT